MVLAKEIFVTVIMVVDDSNVPASGLSINYVIYDENQSLPPWQTGTMDEIAGTAFLAMLLAILFYLIFSAKMNIGFRTAFTLAIPFLLILSLVVSSFSIIYAFTAMLVGWMLAVLFQKMIGNR